MCRKGEGKERRREEGRKVREERKGGREEERDGESMINMWSAATPHNIFWASSDTFEVCVRLCAVSVCVYALATCTG